MTASYDRAPAGLATIRRNGEIIEANQMLRDMVGPATMGASSRFHELLRVGDRIYWETHIGPLLEMQGQVREIALEITTDGGPLPVLLNGAAARPGDPDSTIDLAIFPARDRRAYEAELLSARKRAEESEARARLLAKTLQRSLIPPTVPEMPGLEVGAAYRPARTGVEVGGDFYDFFRLTPTDWCIAIGDVCGKGASAAAVTALVRYTLRGAAMETHILSEAVHAVNQALLLEGSDDMCTLVLARLSPCDAGHQVTLAAAGHPLPRLVDPSGDITSVGRRGTMLGAFTHAPQPLSQLTLRPGDTLVLFTDGITEAQRGGEFLGDGGLDKLLAEHHLLDAGELAELVADTAAKYQDGDPRDDMAVVVVRDSAG